MEQRDKSSGTRPADPGYSVNHSGAVTAAAVVAKSRELLNTPYLHQGRTRMGIDCVGVPILVMRELGVFPPELQATNYGRLSNGQLIAACQRFCAPLEHDELGCLVVIRWPGEKEAGHVAIRTDLGILHAYKNHGGVREHGYRAKWPEWTDSFWRLPGVTGG